MRATDRIVPEVMRTAAMPERAKKTHKLMEYPILGHTSQMWEFFLQELKDIADVADLFPETRTAVELALALRQDAINMLGRDEAVDAKTTANLLTALYFLNAKPGTEISDDAYGDVLADIARIRAIIQGVHGASPGLRMVEKTDYYGWLVMFMLANAVNKAFSEMSDKSWLESNLLLDSALRVCQTNYCDIFQDVHVFINGGELGGATTASWHAHLLEKLNEKYVDTLPERGEHHLITQDDFSRLRRRRLDGRLIQDFLGDVATENFLHLGEILPKSDVPPGHAPFIARIRHLAEELAHPDVDSDFSRVLTELAKPNIRNPFGKVPAYLSVLDFLKADDSDYLFPLPMNAGQVAKKGGGLSPVERKRLLCRHIARYDKKIAYWDKYKKNVSLSPLTEIFSGAILAKLSQVGLKQAIDHVLNESCDIPDGLAIQVKILTDIRSLDGEYTIPEIVFSADPQVWALYGKKIFAVAEDWLNDWWGKTFDIAESYCKLIENKSENLSEKKSLLADLDAQFNLSGYFSNLKWRNVSFELEPGALNYASAHHAKYDDIEAAVINYLEYFIACFARSARHSKKNGLHKRTLCPRNTIIRLSRTSEGWRRQTIIRPMVAYKPLMSLPSFNTLLGPIGLLAEANARFEVVTIGRKQWVVQKMGGEDVLFQRDKRKHYYGMRYRRQQYERDFISGINHNIKLDIMNDAFLGKIDPLYRWYYIREHCANSGVSFRVVSRILEQTGLAAAPKAAQVKALTATLDDEAERQEVERHLALALNHADKEMEKVGRRLQDNQHGFLHYKRIEAALKPLRKEKDFSKLLDGAGLPQHKILRDHIVQIIAIREMERAAELQRANQQPEAAVLQARAAVQEDNLDTILFFNLAEGLVSCAFAGVVAAREQGRSLQPKKQKAILRDTRNALFLLSDTVARLLYRFMISHEQREVFRASVAGGHLSDDLVTGMIAYVSQGLVFSGYKTKEFWELEGRPEIEGYVELLLENRVPQQRLDAIIGQRQSYAGAIDRISCQLARRLGYS